MVPMSKDSNVNHEIKRTDPQTLTTEDIPEDYYLLSVFEDLLEEELSVTELSNRQSRPVRPVIRDASELEYRGFAEYRKEASTFRPTKEARELWNDNIESLPPRINLEPEYQAQRWADAQSSSVDELERDQALTLDDVPTDEERLDVLSHLAVEDPSSLKEMTESAPDKGWWTVRRVMTVLFYGGWIEETRDGGQVQIAHEARQLLDEAGVLADDIEVRG